MTPLQLDFSKEVQIGSLRKTRRLISIARSGLNQKLIEFLEEVNPGTIKSNRFYVPQRHA